MPFQWTPNKVTLLRVVVGFAAVILFGRGAWPNLLAVALTVASIALDALDGHLARKKKMATPVGAQLDILGDRMIENVYFTYFAVVGMVSLWLPILFFARGAATDFLRSLAMKAGHSGWGANAMVQTGWGRALVASREQDVALRGAAWARTRREPRTKGRPRRRERRWLRRRIPRGSGACV